MNRKFMLNAAVATLMALGLAACSSGGSSTVKSAGKQAQNHQQGHKHHHGHNVNQGVKNEYGVSVAFNSYGGDGVLNFAKKHVTYSKANELQIENKKIALATDTLDFMMDNSWKYQSVVKYDAPKEKNHGAYLTVGYQTPHQNIPATGSATYKGKAYGLSMIAPHSHADMRGSVSSDVTVGINFGSKEVNFKTENSMLNGKKADYFDLIGSAKLDVQHNRFVNGEIKTAKTAQGGGYPGTLEGHLYGPKAEEVGGTFNIMYGNVIGGFGAKK